MMKISRAFFFIMLATLGGTAHAVVTFDWATVGNPNNPPDQLYTSIFNPDNLRFGSVANTYRISKHEVTNDQYRDFLNAVDPMGTNPNSVYSSFMGSDARGGIDFDAGAASGSRYSSRTNMGNKLGGYRVDWLIAGGESGHGCRPLDPAHVRSLRDQCQQKRIPFFFKQWGGRTPKQRGRELDGREWSELPTAISSSR